MAESGCTFCSRKKDETQLLISGGEGVFICDQCITQANTLLEEELRFSEKKKTHKEIALIKPKEIKAILDEYVIGQEQAKKVISVAVYNHYKRINNAHLMDDDDVEIEKSNIVLVGPTGTGKTLIARTIAKLLEVPFCIVDATVFTESGYVGEDVESILSRLLQTCDYDVERAQHGIVYIDEVDKIARKQDNPSLTRDVSGEGVQQGLLKLLEGAEVLVPPEGGRKHPDQKLVKVNTGNILFVCGGAFDGIEKVIEKRINTQAVGFKSSREKVLDQENVLQYMTALDLKSFGLIPELIGRLPVLSYLDGLDEDALRRILTQPKNALIKQYTKLFKLEGVELTVEDDALDYITKRALENKLGARGLRGICERILTDAMFEVPSQEKITKLVIDLKYVKEKLNALEFKNMKVA